MKQIVLPIVFCIVASCNLRNPNNQATVEPDWQPVLNSYATGFKVEKSEEGYLITIGHPNDHTVKFQSVYLFSGSEPEEVNADFHLRIPLKKVAALATTHIGFLDAIHELESISGVTDPFRVYNRAVRRGIASGSVQNLGESMIPDKEKILAMRPDAVFMSGFPNAKQNHQVFINADIPLIYTVAWTEKTPLARAEWVKFFGLLYDKKKLADSVFADVEKRYMAIRNRAAQYPDQPSVFCGNSFKGVWYLPGGDSYIATYIEDAGGEYIFKNDTATGSMAVSFEVVYKEARDADFWLNVQEKTLAEMLAKDSRYSTFKPVQSGKVFNRQQRGEINKGNDYYETGTWRPDMVLNDLINVFHGEDSTGRLMFYRQLDK